MIALTNASAISVPANSNPMPQVRSAMLNWFKPIRLGKVLKKQDNYETEEVTTFVDTAGILQPWSPQQLKMLPEGQRKWVHKMLHALPELSLIPDEVVSIDGIKYRVEEKTDYTIYGYVQYNLVQDYTNV